MKYFECLIAPICEKLIEGENFNLNLLVSCFIIKKIIEKQNINREKHFERLIAPICEKLIEEEKFNLNLLISCFIPKKESSRNKILIEKT